MQSLDDGNAMREDIKLLKEDLRAVKAAQPPEMNRWELFKLEKRNEEAIVQNLEHTSRKKRFKKVKPYHPLDFTIPNTVPELEQLSRKQKTDILTAFDVQWSEDDLDSTVMRRVLYELGLSEHIGKMLDRESRENEKAAKRRQKEADKRLSCI